MPQSTQRPKGPAADMWSRRWTILAWLVWAAFLGTVTLVVVHEHEARSVTPVYRGAAQAWWAGRDLYGTGMHGFLYLPPSAVLYTPFGWLPGLWGGITWRWVSVVTLAAAVWRLAARTGGTTDARFLGITLLTLPTLAGSARNGQMNVLMAALMVHAAVDLGQQQWGRSAVGLALMVALKPTSVPMALLAGALYPPMSWRIAVALLASCAVPFATAAPPYVWGQYLAWLHKMHVAVHPPPGRYQDLTGIMHVLGYAPPWPWMTVVRVLAAGATLAAGWLAVHRLDQTRGAVLLFALSAVYMLLWNPRTEGVTYVVLIPAVAVCAMWAFDEPATSEAGWLCVAIALVLGFSQFITGKPNLWMRPAVTVVFLGYLVTFLQVPQPRGSERATAASVQRGQ